MNKNFRNDSLQISLKRYETTTVNKLVLTIDSDYSGSERKSQLYVDEKRLSEQVEKVWRSIKTKKLLSINLYFDEIDWYDSMTNIYHTPVIKIERGMKKIKIGYREHGSIPKDWSINFTAVFSNTKVVTPIIEVVKSVLSPYFTPSMEKDFTKLIRTVLQGKGKYCNYYTEH
jgi:hypothetical protein